ncbi:hypothetical protein BMF94_7016 [Rhodotorula taiwanensis]|uniref:Uncharacterized protein n=1 Tax=Rhodotorula taiwanensis TaxID=741276 RepID=A0A2S5AZK3_9BASI|nr:hypothetical protein BMF94_7016 [Rhodotorula taiwanensis]
MSCAESDSASGSSEEEYEEDSVPDGWNLPAVAIGDSLLPTLRFVPRDWKRCKDGSIAHNRSIESFRRSASEGDAGLEAVLGKVLKKRYKLEFTPRYLAFLLCVCIDSNADFDHQGSQHDFADASEAYFDASFKADRGQATYLIGRIFSEKVFPHLPRRIKAFRELSTRRQSYYRRKENKATSGWGKQKGIHQA